MSFDEELRDERGGKVKGNLVLRVEGALLSVCLRVRSSFGVAEGKPPFVADVKDWPFVFTRNVGGNVCSVNDEVVDLHENWQLSFSNMFPQGKLECVIWVQQSTVMRFFKDDWAWKSSGEAACVFAINYKESCGIEGDACYTFWNV